MSNREDDEVIDEMQEINADDFAKIQKALNLSKGDTTTLENLSQAVDDIAAKDYDARDKALLEGETTTDESFMEKRYGTGGEVDQFVLKELTPTTTDAVEEQVDEFIHLFTGITAPNDVVRDFLRTALTQAEQRGAEKERESYKSAAVATFNKRDGSLFVEIEVPINETWESAEFFYKTNPHSI
jgi:hypothetical protein